MTHSTTVALALAISLGTSALGAEPATVVRHRLDALLDSTRAERKIVGAAATIIFPNGDRWNGASGEASRGTAVTPESLFEIGSITKTYTSALVLSFVATGTLALDDSLTRWMPDFPHAAGVTVRHLLQHTSGLYNYTDNPDYIPALRADFAKIWKPEDSFAFMQEPYFAPGQGWHYSNANYILLGLVCERIGGAPFHALLRARVLAPQSLSRTFFRPDEAVAGPMAHAFLDINDDGVPEDLSMLVTPTSFITAAWSAGALVATADDLASWLRAFCSGKVVQSTLFDELTRWVDRGDGMEYGLGLIRKPHGGGDIYGHKGNTVGYSASVWHAPGDNITVAVLTNAHAVDVTTIASALLDAAIDGD